MKYLCKLWAHWPYGRVTVKNKHVQRNMEDNPTFQLMDIINVCIRYFECEQSINSWLIQRLSFLIVIRLI